MPTNSRRESITEHHKNKIPQHWKIPGTQKDEWNLDHLALVLVFFGWSAHYIYLVGTETQHAVDWDVLHGAVGRVDLNVTLKTWKKCHLYSLHLLCIQVRTPDKENFTSWIKFLRKIVFWRSGSCTNPSEKKIMPWGKLCWESHDTTLCFCMSGRPVM